MKTLSLIILIGLIGAAGADSISIGEASKPYTMTFAEWVVVWVTTHYLQSLPRGASVWFRTEHSEERPGELVFYLWVLIWDPEAEDAYTGPTGIVNHLQEWIRNDCNRWKQEGYNIDFEADVEFVVKGPMQ